MRSLRRVGLHGRPSGCLTPEDGPGLDVLQRVIAAYGPERFLGQGRRRAADRALRAAARRLAADARAVDPVRAERLLVELRRAWQGWPAVQGVPDDGVRRALWDRLVLLCCEEFYAPAGQPGTSPAGPPPA